MERFRTKKTFKNTAGLQFVMDAEMERQLCFKGQRLCFLFE